MNTTINILGTNYNIKKTSKDNDPILEENSGYCDDTTKTIVIEEVTPDIFSKGDLDAYIKRVTRHEIIHAFLSESGLQGSCDWAVNETVVDYFAIQLPKMVKAMKKAKCL